MFLRDCFCTIVLHTCSHDTFNSTESIREVWMQPKPAYYISSLFYNKIAPNISVFQHKLQNLMILKLEQWVFPFYMPYLHNNGHFVRVHLAIHMQPHYSKVQEIFISYVPNALLIELFSQTALFVLLFF